jgi:hypothetical protein
MRSKASIKYNHATATTKSMLTPVLTNHLHTYSISASTQPHLQDEVKGEQLERAVRLHALLA